VRASLEALLLKRIGGVIYTQMLHILPVAEPGETQFVATSTSTLFEESRQALQSMFA
jgi:hypothetical protein